MYLFESTKNTRAVIKNSLRYIRSDVPSVVSDFERERLIKNNINTIVDLRERTERIKKSCILENDGSFRYISFEITGGGSIPKSAGEVALSYIKMADSIMEDAVNTIMNADTNVLYFCNAGKDRTGVATAIILNRLGYSDSYIIDDYLISGKNLEGELKAFAEKNPDVDINVIMPKAEYIKKFLEWYKISRLFSGDKAP